MGYRRKCIKEKYCDILLAAYNHTQSEITRYRDREWAVPGIFIAAMVATIGFIISNKKIEIHQYRYEIEIFLFILTIGNTFYSILTHDKLTKQRVIRNDIEYKLKIQDYSAHGIKIFESYKIQSPNVIDTNTEWFEGFWDHILPFILSGWILLFAGRSILFLPSHMCFVNISHLVIITFFIGMYFLSK